MIEVKRTPLTTQALRQLERPPSRSDIIKVSRGINKHVTGPMLHEFVLDNFLSGGRPEFKENRPLTVWMKQQLGYPTKPLWATGELFQKAILDPVIKTDERGARLQIRNSTARLRASAQFLHDGGEVRQTVTDRMRSFFWAMHYKASGQGDLDVAGAFKAMALSKVLSSKVPARPWTKLLPSQLKQILTRNKQAWTTVITRYARTGKLTFIPSRDAGT